MSEGHNPYAPPLAEVKDAPQAEQALAGRGIRLVAAILDGLMQMALFFVASLVFPWSVFRIDSVGSSLVTAAVMGLGFFLLLHGYLLVKRGQTVAKMLLGLRIVRTDGSPVSPGRILGLRYAVGIVITMIPFIGMFYALLDCLLIFRQSRQCLHDQIADTIVIRA